MFLCFQIYMKAQKRAHFHVFSLFLVPSAFFYPPLHHNGKWSIALHTCSIITYMTNACISLRCFGINYLNPADGLNLFTTALLYIGGSTIALIFISIYLSYVLPSEYGVRKSPFFPLIGQFLTNRVIAG